MSNPYEPYREDAEEQHRYSIRHKYSAVAHPRYGDAFELDVEDCNITFDSSWSPYIQGDLTVKLIEDQDKLDALDPRIGCRVSIYAGYIYDGFVDDVWLLADLHLRSSPVERPGNVIKLRLESDERLAADYKRMSWDTTPPTTGINELVQYHANIACRPVVPTVVSDFAAGYGAAELAGMTQEPGQDSLRMIQDAAERLNLWIYVDGDRTWRIKKKSEYVGKSSLKLATGPASTIFSTSTVRTRGDVEGSGFHNAVCLRYAWRDGAGVEQVIYGNAAVLTGPYAVTATGYNTFFAERPYAIGSTALANTAASNALASLVGRGYQMTMEAHAAYWLRPGMTITVQLPLGDQMRLLVRQVTFNPVSGTMSLALYQPINVTITTTGS